MQGLLRGARRFASVSRIDSLRSQCTRKRPNPSRMLHEGDKSTVRSWPENYVVVISGFSHVSGDYPANLGESKNNRRLHSLPELPYPNPQFKSIHPWIQATQSSIGDMQI